MPRRTTPRRTRRRFTDEERRRFVRKHAESGTNMRAFAYANDLSETSLAKWRQRYPEERAPKPDPTFIVSELPRVSGDGDLVCELETPSGHRLRLHRGFVVADIASLARSLG